MNKLLISILIIFAAYQVSGLYDKSSKVVQLTTKNFQDQVIKSKSLWLVEFYAPWCGHCKSLTPEYNKAATALEGIIKLGAVDMTTDQSVGGPYGIQGFPTIKFFGDDKSKPADYEGGRTSQAIVSYLLEQAKKISTSRIQKKKKDSSSSGKQSGSGSSDSSNYKTEGDVVILTDKNFDSLVTNSLETWFVKFYAPWCGHCKRLEPDWKQLASELKGEVKVGKVDATVENALGGRFQVQGYPSLKFFIPGKSDMKYEGGRDLSSMKSWALEQKGQNRPVQFEQLISQDVFNKLCKEQQGICIITFLPHIADSNKEERNKYIKNIKDIATKKKSSPLSFLWSQGGDQYSFEEALGLSSGFPTVVAVSWKKKAYATMKASFSKENVESFVNSLVAGSQSVTKLTEALKVKTVDAWDGKDSSQKKEDL